MWQWRRIQKISYTEHKAHKEVMERIGEERLLIRAHNNKKRYGLATSWKETHNYEQLSKENDAVLNGGSCFIVGLYGKPKDEAQQREEWRL